MKEKKLELGSNVVVARNSERIPSASYVGKTGVVKKYIKDDCEIEFDDGSVHYIWEKDLALKVEKCCKYGAEFEEDDCAYALETGTCQYCHDNLK